ncbi:MAG: restriction endonuclease subunit S [Methanobrevibacter sp.]|jgi:type I restriction enzyme S subunit|nr:restriction endonuclease subunit S [Methanobrevibacter sp.]
MSLIDLSQYDKGTTISSLTTKTLNALELKIPSLGYQKRIIQILSFLDERILLTGRVGTLGIIQRINFKSFPSDNTLVITSDYYEYVYQSLKKINYDGLNVGSTQPLITQTDLKDFEVIIPPESILMEFENLSEKIYLGVNKNKIENIKLTKLRDILLPKLMSGEIDVSDVKI